MVGHCQRNGRGLRGGADQSWARSLSLTSFAGRKNITIIKDIAEIKGKRYSVCVIGAGPAGIILALEYARHSPKGSVLLIECGLKSTVENPLDDSIRIQNSPNHHEPYDCTNKGLGGTSKTWGGRCVMYDEVDFLPHGPVQAECTWTPSFLEAVQPFLTVAARYFHCGTPEFELSPDFELNAGPICEHFKSDIVTDTRLERWSLPTRFGAEHRRELAALSSIDVLQGHYAFNFTDLDASSNVQSLNVKPIDGNDVRQIHAEKFVVSAGGQETTRLLLKSPEIFRPLGGMPQALGRYYQGHVSGKIAFIKFSGDPDKTDYGFLRDKQGVFCRRRFQFTKKALQEHGLLNVAFWLDNPPVYDPSHGNGTLSFIYLMMITPWLRKKLLPPAIARSLTAGKSYALRRHCGNVARGLPGALVNPAIIFARRYLNRRKLPGVFLKSQANRYALHYHSEQIPLQENRMSLDSDGQTLVIEYAYCAQDIDSVIRAHKLLDKTLRDAGCGHLEYLYEEAALPDAIRSYSMDGLHQVGTTRIAGSPQDGVVDTDLRVWGTRNLYVCSSSAFPTSSQANPTFFLGACAARLAQHLSN